VRRSNTVQIAFLAAIVLTAAGCATVGLSSTPVPATTSVETLEYYPFQVKGYQNSYPHRTMLVLMPTDEHDKSDSGAIDSAPLNGNPQIGVVLDQQGNISLRLYSVPIGPIVQKAIERSADEAGLTDRTSNDVAYKPGVKLADEYVLAGKIRKCWVKKTRAADGHYGPVWRTTAEVALDISIYKPPFSVPFWQGTVTDTYYDPPVGSFGLGPEDEAGIYDEPGQVLSVALTRSVAGIFQRQDLRNLVLEDDIRAH
jgi:hypothetical protein